jgi:hypothetical protein
MTDFVQRVTAVEQVVYQNHNKITKAKYISDAEVLNIEFQLHMIIMSDISLPVRINIQTNIIMISRTCCR